MGYDLHITRASDWTEAEDGPITSEEWLAFVETDPELRLAGDNGRHFALGAGKSNYPEPWFYGGVAECTPRTQIHRSSKRRSRERNSLELAFLVTMASATFQMARSKGTEWWPILGHSMASGSVDLSLLVREVIQAARAAGLREAADELEARTSAAYATSSEWLGEVGLAIQHFLSRERGQVPVALERRLYEGLAEVRKVWPDLD